MTITSTSSKPFEKIFLDVVGPLNPTENNNKFILTFIDDLTKFFIAIPIPNQEANTIAKNFTTEINCKFGMPQTVLTDQGTNFESAIFRETCKLLKIKKIHGTSFHPQTNGSLERTHRTLAEYRRSFINRDRDNWDEFLPFAAFTYSVVQHLPFLRLHV
jgi:transposase InsO family protein